MADLPDEHYVIIEADGVSIKFSKPNATLSEYPNIEVFAKDVQAAGEKYPISKEDGRLCISAEELTVFLRKYLLPSTSPSPSSTEEQTTAKPYPFSTKSLYCIIACPFENELDIWYKSLFSLENGNLISGVFGCHPCQMAFFSTGASHGLVVNVERERVWIAPFFDSCQDICLTESIDYLKINNGNGNVTNEESDLAVFFDRKEGHGNNAHLSLQENILNILNGRIDIEKRFQLIDNIFLCGSIVKNIPSFSTIFKLSLDSLLASSEYPNEFQPKACRMLNIPDYFTIFKGRNDIAVYIGGNILSRIVFSDGKAGYISKSDFLASMKDDMKDETEMALDGEKEVKENGNESTVNKK